MTMVIKALEYLLSRFFSLAVTESIVGDILEQYFLTVEERGKLQARYLLIRELCGVFILTIKMGLRLLLEPIRRIIGRIILAVLSVGVRGETSNSEQKYKNFRQGSEQNIKDSEVIFE